MAPQKKVKIVHIGESEPNRQLHTAMLGETTHTSPSTLDESCSRCNGRHLERNCRRSTGACFKCGQMGHLIKHCPALRKKAATSTKTQGGSHSLNPAATRVSQVLQTFSISASTSIDTCAQCGKSHEMETCRRALGTCFKCGVRGHRIKNCTTMHRGQIASTSTSETILPTTQGYISNVLAQDAQVAHEDSQGLVSTGFLQCLQRKKEEGGWRFL